MKTFRYIALIVAILQLVKGLVIVDSVIASSCIYYMKQFDWGCNSTGNSASVYTCRCKNINWLGSITNCIYEEADNVGSRDHGYEHVMKRCYTKSGYQIDYTLEKFYAIQDNATDYLKYPNNTRDISELVNYPLGVNQTDFLYYHETFKTIMSHVYKTQLFGISLNLFWVAVIAISVIYNQIQAFIPCVISNKLKSILIEASINKNYYNAAYYFGDILPISFSLRVEFLVNLIFWIMVVIFTIVNYDIILPNAYLGSSKFYNLLDFISYRTSIMSFSLLPSMYYMGIRNSPLVYFVNWSRKTFLGFHKNIAYAVTILAFVHSCVWTAYTIEEGDYSAWAIDAYWQWGIIAMILLGLIIFASLHWFRIVIYEVFLISHHLMSILFIIAIYFHANTLGWLGWCYSIIAIYSWDKLMRLFKITTSGSIIKFSTVKYFDANVMKLSIPFKAETKLGCYSYFYFLAPNSIFNCWQSHPFSIYPDPEDDGKVIALIKIKNGITKKLYKHILKLAQQKSINDIRIPLIIEGPYGYSSEHIFNFNESSSYVLFASGSGITSIFSYVLKILKNCTDDTGKIRLFWIVRNLNEVLWFENEITNLVKTYCKNSTTGILKIEIIVTARPSSNTVHNYIALQKQDPSNDESECESISKGPKKLLSYINSRSFKISHLPFGTRPCLSKIVELNQINRRTHFISCGPPEFTDSIRKFVNKYRKNEDTEFPIEYHELSFVW